MSIKSQVILSGQIDENSFIDYPAHFNTKTDKKYRLSVHDGSSSVKLKFERQNDTVINTEDNTWTIYLPFINEKPTTEFITDIDSPSDLIYDCIIDWGDNSTSEITSYVETKLKHNYDGNTSAAMVSISGTFPGFKNQNGNAWKELVEIVDWRTRQFIFINGVCIL